MAVTVRQVCESIFAVVDALKERGVDEDRIDIHYALDGVFVTLDWQEGTPVDHSDSAAIFTTPIEEALVQRIAEGFDIYAAHVYSLSPEVRQGIREMWKGELRADRLMRAPPADPVPDTEANASADPAAALIKPDAKVVWLKPRNAANAERCKQMYPVCAFEETPNAWTGWLDGHPEHAGRWLKTEWTVACGPPVCMCNPVARA